METQLDFLDSLYQAYLISPESIDPSWRSFFDQIEIKPQIVAEENRGAHVLGLIDAYRVYGHLAAHIDPLSDIPALPVQLSPSFWGFNDMHEAVSSCGFCKIETIQIGKLIEMLKSIYCGHRGIEYMGLGGDLERYIQSMIEPESAIHLSLEDKREIMQMLHSAELLEAFLHTKYFGQKRFSLEGSETLIPMLRFLITEGALLGFESAVIGMSHRGRLNVLTNIMGKSYADIFCEFEDYYKPGLFEGTGDVKYHKGYSGSLQCRNGKTARLFLAANPSHLESVDPVVEGQVFALQKRGERSYPILIHGDAALAGQGVVYETMQLQGLQGYGTQGTIHIVVNNQVGFTAKPEESRSTRYCTDIARSFGAPVLHVNAEDPEECVIAAMLAMRIKHRFSCDVFIDLNGYRKYGHNESDEPAFTQPLMYQKVRAKRSVRAIYTQKLVEQGALTHEEALLDEEAFKRQLQAALDHISTHTPQPKESQPAKEPKETKISEDRAYFLLEACTKIPEGFCAHSKIEKLMQERRKAFNDFVDWATAEMLAYGSLVDEGIHVRLSGQDAGRGTFSHRHSIWIDQKTGSSYCPLAHIREGQAPFEVYNSPLSEYAVLGFEFGYSTVYTRSLVIWEAQFGDFANGAQIVIDQYLAASKQKWAQGSPLTLMLPHGYEGQGPEHSSARIERFLQLCGQNNMCVVNPTTPAQLFHVLRRQVDAENPLIIFTPKALLRHPMVRSSKEALLTGCFTPILDDPAAVQSTRKLLLCSGKIYYDLVKEKEKRGVDDIAIVRIEQLYPFPQKEIDLIVKKYHIDPTWVQEEPANMGAATYMRALMPKLKYVGRAVAASPAVGLHALHDMQYKILMDEAFA